MKLLTKEPLGLEVINETVETDAGRALDAFHRLLDLPGIYDVAPRELPAFSHRAFPYLAEHKLDLGPSLHQLRQNVAKFGRP